MNGVLKPLAALAVTALLGLALAACGSGGSSTSTGSTPAGTTSAQKQGGTTTTAAGAGKNTGSGEGQGKSGGSGSAEEKSNFVPKHHSDSGGGSKQFRTKGGDNSIQEFGSEAPESEFDEAAVALHNFLDARAEGNWAAVCTYMSKATITSIEHLARGAKPGTDTSCGAILAGVISPAAQPQIKAEAEKANVRSLRTEGEQAFVIYTGIDKTVLAMPMAHEGGSWKVTSLAGTPLS
jgi:hypothetical protein